VWKGQGSVPDELIEQMPRRAWSASRSITPTTTTEPARGIARWPERLDLVPTGSSDCHGARYGYRMGAYTTPAEVYQELRQRAGR